MLGGYVDGFVVSWPVSAAANPVQAPALNASMFARLDGTSSGGTCTAGPLRRTTTWLAISLRWCSRGERGRRGRVVTGCSRGKRGDQRVARVAPAPRARARRVARSTRTGGIRGHRRRSRLYPVACHRRGTFRPAGRPPVHPYVAESGMRRNEGGGRASRGHQRALGVRDCGERRGACAVAHAARGAMRLLGGREAA
jgi:hypothetical protein